ncbi:MAG: efflux RND transporter periplasmic adaptor subunit [Puniceicoccales bacterium]
MNVSKKHLFTATIISAGAAFALLLAGCGEKTPDGSGGASRAGGGLPKVDVVTVSPQVLPWEKSYPGRVEGLRRVVIRPRVGGLILDRKFEEGNVVKKDEVLFEIDPAPFEVTLHQAQAQLERAEANFRQGEREWNRAQKLFDTEALSERQRDQAQSQYELAKADVAVAEAAVAEAQLQLDYTEVRSPVSGVTGLEEFPRGSLVNIGDRLTEVTQIDPFYVLFSLPEGDPAYEAVFGGGDEQGDYQLQLRSRNNRLYSEEGRINFVASRIDDQTGTVRVRAEFPNPDNKVLPGQFVRVTFDGLQLAGSFVIPEEAVLTTANGSMVYVVGEGNVVTPRPVVLGPVTNEGQVVQSGLSDGDRVISSSLIRIRPGQEIEPIEKSKVDSSSSREASAQNVESSDEQTQSNVQE